MSEHRASLRSGHRIQWYVVREVLGQGGFGITYLAEDTNLNLQVAIKEYLPVDMAVREGDASVHPLTGEHGEQFRWGLERFISEAQTLARFKHANIVRVFTVFAANNTAYMVMEYEQGRSLAEVLKERKTLPERDLRVMLLPLLDGLEQVHAHGFIHRDIKPANIFVRGNGSPVLLDFGSARQSLGEHTHTLTAMVSPGFAPFEQYAGKGERQGPWTDIYGLGATLYRAVVGRAPANAMDRSEALLRTSRDVFVGAAEISPPGYSPALLRAIDHALNFRIEDRPATIADWRREFAGEASAAAPVSTEVATALPTAATVKITIDGDAMPVPAAEKRGRRWDRMLAAVAAIFVALVLLSAIGMRSNRVAETTASPPVETKSFHADSVLEGTGRPPAEAGHFDQSDEDAEVLPSSAQTDAAVAEGPAGKRDSTTEPPIPTETDSLPRAPQSAIDPDSPGASRALARGPTVSAPSRERLAKLQENLRRDPRNRKTLQALRETIDEYERLARQAVRDGDYNAAEQYLLDMLTLAPNNRKLKDALEEVRRANPRQEGGH